MSYRTLRRRMSEAMAAHDWLEGVSVGVGLVFLVLAVLCAWGLVTAITSWGDADPGFKTTVGFLKVTRGFGVVLFALFGFLALGVGWFLAGDWIRRLLRRNRKAT
jgi:hypothetical protein